MNTQAAAPPAGLPGLLGGILHYVEAPLEAVVGAIAPHAPPAAQATVATAAADPSLDNIEAAIEAVVDPLVRKGVDAVAHAIPILGPIFEGSAEAMAVSAEHVFLAALISRLKSFLPAPCGWHGYIRGGRCVEVDGSDSA